MSALGGILSVMSGAGTGYNEALQRQYDQQQKSQESQLLAERATAMEELRAKNQMDRTKYTTDASGVQRESDRISREGQAKLNREATASNIQTRADVNLQAGKDLEDYKMENIQEWTVKKADANFEAADKMIEKNLEAKGLEKGTAEFEQAKQDIYNKNKESLTEEQRADLKMKAGTLAQKFIKEDPDWVEKKAKEYARKYPEIYGKDAVPTEDQVLGHFADSMMLTKGFEVAGSGPVRPAGQSEVDVAIKAVQAGDEKVAEEQLATRIGAKKAKEVFDQAKRTEAVSGATLTRRELPMTERKSGSGTLSTPEEEAGVLQKWEVQ